MNKLEEFKKRTGICVGLQEVDRNLLDTTANHHCSMRSERNHQGASNSNLHSRIWHRSQFCGVKWGARVLRVRLVWKGPLELENLKNSPDGRMPIWGVKLRK